MPSAETEITVDRATFAEIRDRLHDALTRIEVRQQDRHRWHDDYHRAEAELKCEQQHHANMIKGKIVLRNEIAALKAKRPRTR